MDYRFVRRVAGWYIQILNDSNQAEWAIGPFRSRKSANENSMQLIEFGGARYHQGRAAEKKWQERGR